MVNDTPNVILFRKKYNEFYLNILNNNYTVRESTEKHSKQFFDLLKYCNLNIFEKYRHYTTISGKALDEIAVNENLFIIVYNKSKFAITAYGSDEGELCIFEQNETSFKIIVPSIGNMLLSEYDDEFHNLLISDSLVVTIVPNDMIEIRNCLIKFCKIKVIIENDIIEFFNHNNIMAFEYGNNKITQVSYGTFTLVYRTIGNDIHFYFKDVMIAARNISIDVTTKFISDDSFISVATEPNQYIDETNFSEKEYFFLQRDKEKFEIIINPKFSAKEIIVKSDINVMIEVFDKIWSTLTNIMIELKTNPINIKTKLQIKLNFSKFGITNDCYRDIIDNLRIYSIYDIKLVVDSVSDAALCEHYLNKDDKKDEEDIRENKRGDIFNQIGLNKIRNSQLLVEFIKTNSGQSHLNVNRIKNETYATDEMSNKTLQSIHLVHNGCCVLKTHDFLKLSGHYVVDLENANDKLLKAFSKLSLKYTPDILIYNDITKSITIFDCKTSMNELSGTNQLRETLQKYQMYFNQKLFLINFTFDGFVFVRNRIRFENTFPTTLQRVIFSKLTEDFNQIFINSIKVSHLNKKEYSDFIQLEKDVPDLEILVNNMLKQTIDMSLTDLDKILISFENNTTDNLAKCKILIKNYTKDAQPIFKDPKKEFNEVISLYNNALSDENLNLINSFVPNLIINKLNLFEFNEFIYTLSYVDSYHQNAKIDKKPSNIFVTILNDIHLARLGKSKHYVTLNPYTKSVSFDETKLPSEDYKKGLKKLRLISHPYSVRKNVHCNLYRNAPDHFEMLKSFLTNEDSYNVLQEVYDNAEIDESLRIYLKNIVMTDMPNSYHANLMLIMYYMANELLKIKNIKTDRNVYIFKRYNVGIYYFNDGNPNHVSISWFKVLPKEKAIELFEKEKYTNHKNVYLLETSITGYYQIVYTVVRVHNEVLVKWLNYPAQIALYLSLSSTSEVFSTRKFDNLCNMTLICSNSYHYNSEVMDDLIMCLNATLSDKINILTNFKKKIMLKHYKFNTMDVQWLLNKVVKNLNILHTNFTSQDSVMPLDEEGKPDFSSSTPTIYTKNWYYLESDAVDKISLEEFMVVTRIIKNTTKKTQNNIEIIESFFLDVMDRLENYKIDLMKHDKYKNIKDIGHKTIIRNIPKTRQLIYEKDTKIVENRFNDTFDLSLFIILSAQFDDIDFDAKILRDNAEKIIKDSKLTHNPLEDINTHASLNEIDRKREKNAVAILNRTYKILDSGKLDPTNVDIAKSFINDMKPHYESGWIQAVNAFVKPESGKANRPVEVFNAAYHIIQRFENAISSSTSPANNIVKFRTNSHKIFQTLTEKEIKIISDHDTNNKYNKVLLAAIDWTKFSPTMDAIYQMFKNIKHYHILKTKLNCPKLAHFMLFSQLMSTNMSFDVLNSYLDVRDETLNEYITKLDLLPQGYYHFEKAGNIVTSQTVADLIKKHIRNISKICKDDRFDRITTLFEKFDVRLESGHEIGGFFYNHNIFKIKKEFPNGIILPISKALGWEMLSVTAAQVNIYKYVYGKCLGKIINNDRERVFEPELEDCTIFVFKTDKGYLCLQIYSDDIKILTKSLKYEDGYAEVERFLILSPFVVGHIANYTKVSISKFFCQLIGVVSLFLGMMVDLNSKAIELAKSYITITSDLDNLPLLAANIKARGVDGLPYDAILITHMLYTSKFKEFITSDKLDMLDDIKYMDNIKEKIKKCKQDKYTNIIDEILAKPTKHISYNNRIKNFNNIQSINTALVNFNDDKLTLTHIIPSNLPLDFSLMMQCYDSPFKYRCYREKFDYANSFQIEEIEDRKFNKYTYTSQNNIKFRTSLHFQSVDKSIKAATDRILNLVKTIMTIHQKNHYIDLYEDMLPKLKSMLLQTGFVDAKNGLLKTFLLLDRIKCGKIDMKVDDVKKVISKSVYSRGKLIYLLPLNYVDADELTKLLVDYIDDVDDAISNINVVKVLIQLSTLKPDVKFIKVDEFILKYVLCKKAYLRTDEIDPDEFRLMTQTYDLNIIPPDLYQTYLNALSKDFIRVKKPLMYYQIKPIFKTLDVNFTATERLLAYAVGETTKDNLYDILSELKIEITQKASFNLDILNNLTQLFGKDLAIMVLETMSTSPINYQMIKLGHDVTTDYIYSILTENFSCNYALTSNESFKSIVHTYYKKFDLKLPATYIVSEFYRNRTLNKCGFEKFKNAKPEIFDIVKLKSITTFADPSIKYLYDIMQGSDYHYAIEAYTDYVIDADSKLPDLTRISNNSISVQVETSQVVIYINLIRIQVLSDIDLFKIIIYTKNVQLLTSNFFYKLKKFLLETRYISSKNKNYYFNFFSQENLSDLSAEVGSFHNNLMSLNKLTIADSKFYIDKSCNIFYSDTKNFKIATQAFPYISLADEIDNDTKFEVMRSIYFDPIRNTINANIATQLKKTSKRSKIFVYFNNRHAMSDLVVDWDNFPSIVYNYYIKCNKIYVNCLTNKTQFPIDNTPVDATKKFSIDLTNLQKFKISLQNIIYDTFVVLESKAIFIDFNKTFEGGKFSNYELLTIVINYFFQIKKRLLGQGILDENILVYSKSENVVIYQRLHHDQDHFFQSIIESAHSTDELISLFVAVLMYLIKESERFYGFMKGLNVVSMFENLKSLPFDLVYYTDEIMIENGLNICILKDKFEVFFSETRNRYLTLPPAKIIDMSKYSMKKLTSITFPLRHSDEMTLYDLTSSNNLEFLSINSKANYLTQRSDNLNFLTEVFKKFISKISILADLAIACYNKNMTYKFDENADLINEYALYYVCSNEFDRQLKNIFSTMKCFNDIKNYFIISEDQITGWKNLTIRSATGLAKETIEDHFIDIGYKPDKVLYCEVFKSYDTMDEKIKNLIIERLTTEADMIVDKPRRIYEESEKLALLKHKHVKDFVRKLGNTFLISHLDLTLIVNQPLHVTECNAYHRFSGDESVVSMINFDIFYKYIVKNNINFDMTKLARYTKFYTQSFTIDLEFKPQEYGMLTLDNMIPLQKFYRTIENYFSSMDIDIIRSQIKSIIEICLDAQPDNDIVTPINTTDFIKSCYQRYYNYSKLYKTPPLTDNLANIIMGITKKIDYEELFSHMNQSDEITLSFTTFSKMTINDYLNTDDDNILMQSLGVTYDALCIFKRKIEHKIFALNENDFSQLENIVTRDITKLEEYRDLLANKKIELEGVTIDISDKEVLCRLLESLTTIPTDAMMKKLLHDLGDDYLSDLTKSNTMNNVVIEDFNDKMYITVAKLNMMKDDIKESVIGKTYRKHFRLSEIRKFKSKNEVDFVLANYQNIIDHVIDTIQDAVEGHTINITSLPEFVEDETFAVDTIVSLINLINKHIFNASNENEVPETIDLETGIPTVVSTTTLVASNNQYSDYEDYYDDMDDYD